MRRAIYIAGLMLALAAVASPAFAGTNPVPEVDGNSLTLGLGLLSGSVLLLRARFRRK